MANADEKLKRKYALAIVRQINKLANEHGGVDFDADFGYDWSLTIGVKGKSHVHIGMPTAGNEELVGLTEILEGLCYMEEQLKDQAKPYNTKAARTLYRKK